MVDEDLEVREGGGVEVAVFRCEALLSIRLDLVEDCCWGLLESYLERGHMEDGGMPGKI